MKKKIIKIVIFFTILLIILIIISAILIPKNNTEEAGINNIQAMGILGEKDNTIDVIMYGDSESYASMIPMRIWKKYGYTLYVCGTSGQSLPDTCKIAYETLKNQKPKIVILEADNVFNSVGITVPIARVINEILPITEYHNRWKSLTKEDFFGKINYTDTDENKGYYYVERTDPVENGKYMEDSEEIEQVPFLNKIYVKILKKYCESKGIQFAIVSVPSYKNWSYQKHNGMKEFTEKEGIEFLDLNKLKKDLNIDWKKETGDKGDHVNYKGAIKVTNYLGKWLEEKNMLEDHRNDENYQKWNEDLNKVLQENKILFE